MTEQTVARKDDLINALVANFEAQDLNLTKKNANIVLDTVLKTIVQVSKDVGSVRTSVGTFRVIDVAERNGINPKTKEKLLIPARRALKFKAASNVLEG